MKPILHSRTYTGTNATHIGTLADATSCIVTEQRNGEYELEMEYLPTGVLANELKTGAVILAIPSYGATAQPFRIYQVDKSLTGTIQVNAHHISYDLNKVYLKYFNDTTGITATLAAIKTNLIQQTGDTTDWTFTNDGITNTSSTFKHPEPSTVRAALGGTEGSVLDVFGGEYEWNGFNVIIHKNRGADRGVYVRYAGNLLEFNREEDFENAYTHVMVYWYDEETGNKTTSLSYAVSDVVAADFTQSRTAVINVTDQFETQPNRATLNPVAQDYAAKMTSKPTIGLEVKFVDLNSTTEGGAEAPVKLCDTIHVIDPVRDVSIAAKVVEARWNVLLDRYEDVTIGTKGKNIADTISGLEGSASSGSGGGGGGSTETDYRNLTNKPQINSVELDGNKSLASLGIASASDLAATTAIANAAVKDVTVNGTSVVNSNQVAVVVVPTKTSDITNDSGYITAANAPVRSVNGQTGAVVLSIPDSTSDLTNDSGFITLADVPAAPVQSVNGQTGAVVLSIPDSTSDLTNDSGFITANDIPAQHAKIWTGKVTTAAGTTAKTVTLDEAGDFPGWGSNVIVALTFTNGNTAANPTLSYNNTALPMAGYTGTSITTPSTSAEANKVGKGETILLYPSGQYLVHGATEAQIGDLITNKAPLASPALTGTPTAPTAAAGTNTTQLATTAFVQAAVSGGGGGGYAQKLWTGTVTTAAATAAKTVTLDDPGTFPGWGGNVVVALTFTNGNSAANPTLSYAGLAIPMAGYDGSSITTPSTTAAANMIGAGETVLLYPSGQYYVHGGKSSGGSSGVQSVTPVYSSGTKIASFATSGGTVDLYLPVWNGSVTP